MKALKLLIIVSLLFSGNILAQSDAEITRMKIHIANANSALQSKNWDEALRQVEQAQDILRKPAAIFESIRIKSYHGKKDYKKAKEHVEVFYKTAPANNLIQEMAPIILDIDNKLEEEQRRREKAEIDRRRVEEEERKRKEAELLIPESIRELEKNMVNVQGGTFMMGCIKHGGFGSAGCNTWEEPRHSVSLSNFRIAKFEVTQVQWRSVMGSDPPELHNKGCDNCPVENVSWNDIQEFLNKLNQITGKNYRLPTEAEWEYAARGGNRSRGYFYSGGSNLNSVGWHKDNSDLKTHPVGRKSPNELGLYDMSGNVWEWCSDWYDDNYYKNSPSRNPQGPSSGSNRVIRGGGIFDFWFNHSVYRRSSRKPEFRGRAFGFRVAHNQ